jgi:putative addiction module killer protein
VENGKISIEIYRDGKGRKPFAEWLDGLKDLKTQVKIVNRIKRIELGNFGDRKPIGNGVFELRFHFSPGYRVYYAKVDNTVVLLLSGGKKSDQTKDIQKAKKYWKNYQER